ncbi:flavin monoamine oxidase family protein [Nostoc sp. C110]|uniref:flavin monoamine oxidase family protein n=1 Tax=Nostoc sp. C110 TaxID=3349876 RepID=UPI00370D0D60
MAEIDIAIVGGGVSGVYSAWRLKQAYPDQNIVVFEGSDYIGGRLLSVRPPDISNMVAELGGMRILPAVQPLIAKLIGELNKVLPLEQQIELYDFPVDQPQNIAYLRGVYLRLSDFIIKPDKVPYHLSFLERGGTAGSIIINAIEQIVPGITNPKLTESQRREMVQNASFAGTPLWKQGFWNVLIRIISGEAYELGIDAGGYNSTLTNWNAADAIPWYLSDFGIDPQYKGFKKGFQEVPKSLAQLFSKAGGEIRLNTRLDGFDWKNATFELSIQGETIATKSLILAMPRRSLDLLVPTSPPLLEIQHLITSVTPRPLFKLFTTYTNPWWRAAGYTDDGKFIPVESGRTVTDLPVRQTYYWPKDDGKPATEGPSMLMASYDDGTDIGFWDGLRPRRHQAWQAHRQVAELVKNPYLGTSKQQSNSEWDKYVAPAPMVEEVARQLGIIHGLNYTPDVQNAAFRDWGDDPFGGGWNSWNIGVKSWEVKQQIIQPLGTDCSLYICGEAYSDAQGWVEGALQTSDMVLEKFGISPLLSSTVQRKKQTIK